VEGVEPDKEELSQSENELKTKESDKRTNGSTEVKQGEAPSDVGSEGLQATKGMVKQIRDLASVAGLSVNRQAFADQIELAASSVDGDTDAVIEALGLALSAIGHSWEANNSEEPSAQTTDAESTPEEHEQVFSVEVTEEGERVTYSVADQVISLDTTDDGLDNPVEVIVNLTAVDGGSSISEAKSSTPNDDGSVSEEESFSAVLDLSVTGSAQSDRLSIELQEGSGISGTATFADAAIESETQNEDGTFRERDGQSSGNLSLQADLAILLSQRQPVNEGDSLTSFEGRMGLEVDAFSFNESFSEDTHPNHYTYYNESTGYVKSYSFSYKGEGTESNAVAGFALTLSGKFFDADDSLSASLGVEIGNFAETCTYSYENSGSGEFDNTTYQWDRTSTYSDNEDCTDETEEAYASALLTLLFALDLVGVDDDVNVTVNASRNGLRDGILDLDLSYGGNTLAFDYAYEGYAENETPDSRNKDVTISNHNNVILTLQEVEDDQGATLLTGNITQAGVEYAKVSEESGAVIVRYTDGTFESAM
ncbi:hypothetical protein, partial [Litorivivens sp.]|uniref:hypothetical protein n=1 Tax=Litorivivens sp. TaxID=2020868 RepID=UPI00356627E9